MHNTSDGWCAVSRLTHNRFGCENKRQRKRTVPHNRRCDLVY